MQSSVNKALGSMAAIKTANDIMKSQQAKIAMQKSKEEAKQMKALKSEQQKELKKRQETINKAKKTKEANRKKEEKALLDLVKMPLPKDGEGLYPINQFIREREKEGAK